ncbi:MAG: MBL fold metallo-hydrolase [Sediminibacterium sp.]
MSLFIASLNSGSNGNCYYVGNEQEAVLVDAGLSCRETEKRMKRLGLLMDTVKAIFISHEHGDHIAGVTVLAKKYQLPVYITPPTLKNGRIVLQKEKVKTFIAHQPVSIGSLSITAFQKFHDASDPHSFMINCGLVNVGVFTDLGICCEQLVNHFQKCHAAFLEANYDAEMLEKGSYPYHLKTRIRGGEGHLSNEQALQLFLKHRPAHMSHLLLAHLSKNNNDPKIVEDLFNQYAGNTRIIIATRYKETEVYHITSEGISVPSKLHRKWVVKKPDNQLSLF